MAYVSDVFSAAMAIMDSLDAEGAADNADNEEYKLRTPAIMNVLIGECFPFSQAYEGTNRSAWVPVSSFDDWVSGIDDTLCLTVMPYGLCANLLADENPSLASFCQQRYEELCRRFGVQRMSEWEAIEDVYGGIGFSGGGRWG